MTYDRLGLGQGKGLGGRNNDTMAWCEM
jgi:hypothetical protein